MLVPTQPLVRTYDVNYHQDTSVDRRPFVDGSHPSAVRPFMNLKNKFYVPEQTRLIGRMVPYIKAAQANALNGTVNTVFDFGAASSYRMSDETLRQVTVAHLIQQQQQSFFKLATR